MKLTSTTHDNSTAHSLSYETFVSPVIADQHEWNQAVDNEIAALEGAGFEYDEIGNIVD